jgi:hypothetical protein
VFVALHAFRLLQQMLTPQKPLPFALVKQKQPSPPGHDVVMTPEPQVAPAQAGLD